MSIKTELQSNNTDLQNILNTVNNLPDAGVGEVYAAIGVIYPEGSTCTCTGEGKTWTAKTTAGQWVFPVFKAGTYTVTVTDGTSSKSQSVSITSEGQFESVTFSCQLILFDGGDITAVTGGWDANGHGGPTAVVGETVGLNIDQETSAAWTEKTFIVATKNTIDMSAYTKLCAVITELNADSGEVRVVSEIDSDATAKASVTATVGTVEVDITSTNSGNVGLWISLTSNAYAQFEGSISASKIWLE